MTFTAWIKSLFVRKARRSMEVALAEWERNVRQDIGEEITYLRNQIAKRKKQKKAFRPLETRLNSLMAELLSMDMQP